MKILIGILTLFFVLDSICPLLVTDDVEERVMTEPS